MDSRQRPVAFIWLFTVNNRGRGPNEAKGQLQETAKVSGVGYHDIRNNGDRVNGGVGSIGSGHSASKGCTSLF
jgi:hypothetical protein